MIKFYHQNDNFRNIGLSDYDDNTFEFVHVVWMCSLLGEFTLLWSDVDLVRKFLENSSSSYKFLGNACRCISSTVNMFVDGANVDKWYIYFKFACNYHSDQKKTKYHITILQFGQIAMLSTKIGTVLRSQPTHQMECFRFKANFPRRILPFIKSPLLWDCIALVMRD